MNGWIKLHRKILEWGWYSDINTKVVFIHLLLVANFEDRYYLGKLIKRGDCVIGLNTLAQQTNLTTMQVRTALNHLKSTNEITIKTTNKYSVVSICNFNSYQIVENEDNKQDNTQNNNQVTNKQQTNNKQITTPKEYKNIRIKEGKKEESNAADKSATKKSIEERQKEFYNELVPFVDKYGNDMIRSFYNYWSQVNKGGKKMLWEMQKAFELPKRLSTWHGKGHTSGTNNNGSGEQLYRNNEERMEQAKREGWI